MKIVVDIAVIIIMKIDVYLIMTFDLSAKHKY